MTNPLFFDEGFCPTVRHEMICRAPGLQVSVAFSTNKGEDPKEAELSVLRMLKAYKEGRFTRITSEDDIMRLTKSKKD